MPKTKLLKVSSFYPEYLVKLYREDSNLHAEDYAVQYKRMMDQGIGWADYWKINLEKTGEFDVELIIINNEYAQKKWAEENHIRYDEQNWMNDIFLEQVGMFNPEIVFANDYIFVTPNTIRNIKNKFPVVRKYIGWDGIGLCDTARFNEFDLMLTCNPYVSEFYIKNQIKSLYIPFAFEKEILSKINLNRQLYDVSFVGSVTLRNNGHHERLKVLGAVAAHAKVDYWIASFDESLPYLIKNIVRKMKSGLWSDVSDILRLWRINHGQLFGMEMYQALADSKITLNTHINTALNYGGNIRLWEATGVGTCLVTDWKENMNELFVADKEVVTYKTPMEAVEKVLYLLKNPTVAKAIAEAGQKRTLENYTYEKRLLEAIPSLLN